MHHGTQVLKPVDGAQQPCGQTLWAEAAGDRAAGVAWDWVELCEGVYALADPLGLVTNLQLLDATGSVLGPYETARRLNELVHALPWQAEVRKILGAPAS